jgi:hypothetical protein
MKVTISVWTVKEFVKNKNNIIMINYFSAVTI